MFYILKLIFWKQWYPADLVYNNKLHSMDKLQYQRVFNSLDIDWQVHGSNEPFPIRATNEGRYVKRCLNMLANSLIYVSQVNDPLRLPTDREIFFIINGCTRNLTTEATFRFYKFLQIMYDTAAFFEFHSKFKRKIEKNEQWILRFYQTQMLPLVTEWVFL